MGHVIEVQCEMVANVAAVSVSPGQQVAAGDMVVLLESMKMEIPVLVGEAGTVLEIRVSPGDVVQEGDVLVTVEPDVPRTRRGGSA